MTMNFNGKKNPFTLDYSTKSKEPKRKSDPFAKDPFKVQSYNFRYADPPGYSLKSPYNTCQKSEIPRGNFYESRRRRFLQSNNNPAANMSSDQGKRNIYPQPKVYADYERPFYRPPPPNSFQPQSPDTRSYRPNAADNSARMGFNCGVLSGNSSRNSSSTRLEPSNRRSNIGVQNYSRANNMSNFHTLKPKTSTSSLCQINIKIQRSEDNLMQDRLVINIATNDNSALCTGTSPYSSGRLALKGEASSNSLPALGYRNSQQALQTRTLDQGLTDTSFSSDSSASEYDSHEIERTPQWISVMKTNEKANTSKETQARPKAGGNKLDPVPLVSSPYLGIQKNEVFKRVERKNSTVIEKRSTQTLVNNLNTDDAAKSRIIFTRNASKSFVSLDRKPGNFDFQTPQDRSGLRRSTTNITRRDNFNQSKNSGNKVTASVSARVSAVNLRRTASTVSKNADNSPLHVNINLYNKPRPF